MSFFKMPAPTSLDVATYLEKRLTEIRQEKWAYYLVTCNRGQFVFKAGGKTHVWNLTPNLTRNVDQLDIPIFLPPKALDELLSKWSLRMTEEERATHDKFAKTAWFETFPIIDNSRWNQSKENFSWRPNLGGIELLQLKNAEKQYDHVNHLLLLSRKIVKSLTADTINYQDVKLFADTILKTTTILPSTESTNGGILMNLDDFRFSGHKLPTSFIAGIFGVLVAPLALLVGAITMPLYLSSQTEYLGSPTFLFDCAHYFCKSLVRILSVIPLLTPFAMLEAKATTGSSNVFKGDLLRCINFIKKDAVAHSPIEIPNERVGVQDFPRNRAFNNGDEPIVSRVEASDEDSSKKEDQEDLLGNDRSVSLSNC